MIDQLMPFNEARFDQCMAWFAQESKRPLTQFDMVKLHVLTDVYHVLETALPVIGGALERWPYGPVVKVAFNRVKRWIYRYNEGIDDSPFTITPRNETVYELSGKAIAGFDEEDFSLSELRAMRRALDTLTKHGDFEGAQEFFHSCESFIGRAWTAAGARGAPIDWNEIIDAYDQIEGGDHSHIKKIISLGV